MKNVLSLLSLINVLGVEKCVENKSNEYEGNGNNNE